jgi:hypothetical protein
LPSGDEQAPPGAVEPGAELIQSMLARAVEVQQGDQRELTAAVGEMRAQLMRMSQELAELRLRPPTDETPDAQLNTVTVEMREAVRFLSERLDGVTRMVALRGEELADVRTALTAIDAHVRSQAEAVGVLSAGMQGIPAYGERVVSLQDAVAIVHQQLIGIEASIEATESTALGSRFNGLDAALAALRVDDVGGRLGSMEATAASMAERLAGIDAGQTVQADAIAQLRALAVELHNGVVGLHARIDPVAEDITAIGSGVTGLVEGSADGAALDSRISESVSSAVKSTEERLIAHIDEAIVVLAETLLRRIGAGSPVVAATVADTGAETPWAEFSAGGAAYTEAGTDDVRGTEFVGIDPEFAGIDPEAGDGAWAEGGGQADAATDEDVDSAAADESIEVSSGYDAPSIGDTTTSGLPDGDLDADGDDIDDDADEGAAESGEPWLGGTPDDDDDDGAAGDNDWAGGNADDDTGERDETDFDDADDESTSDTADYVWSSADYDPDTYRGDIVAAEDDDGVGDDTLIPRPPLQADDALEDDAGPAVPDWMAAASEVPDSTVESLTSPDETAADTEPERPETPASAAATQPDPPDVSERDPADPTISLDAPRKRWWRRG